MKLGDRVLTVKGPWAGNMGVVTELLEAPVQGFDILVTLDNGARTLGDKTYYKPTGWPGPADNPSHGGEK